MRDLPEYLLVPGWIVTVDSDDRVLTDHALAIGGGRILAIKARAEAEALWPDAPVHRYPDHAIMPGLVNAHTHAAMNLFRGLADDLPLMTWLQEHVWPAEGRWVDEAFVGDGTELAFAEMIVGGVTCFNDMYFFPEVSARLAAEHGVRATIGMILLDFPTQYADGPDQYLDKGLALHDRYRDHPLVQTAFAPHAPYTVSDGPLQRVRTYADELERPIHIHVHETQAECAQAAADHGERPIARLQRLGLLSRDLAAVHMVHLTDDEIAATARAGASVIHCPESNLKLASGMAPVQSLIDAGVNVALGTDSVASNNDLDLFGEMRTAALLGKAVAGDAAAVDAATALRMATINGARALGLDNVTGSLEPGKAADMIALDLSGPETRPVFDVTSQLVYATGRPQVTDVWIAGHQQLRDGRLTTLESRELSRRAAVWGERIGGAG
jgi:5-methylthioadenosine/S-adenosylhomocysteine deaminase